MWMRYVAEQKKQGIQRRELHLNFDSIIVNYQGMGGKDKQ